VTRLLARALERLDALLRQTDGFPPAEGVWMVEIASSAPMDDHGRLRVHRRDLIEEAAYAPRFEALLALGPPWLNVSCYGVYDGRLVVAIELPAPPLDRGCTTAINVSGPSIAARARGFAVDAVLTIET
jgi:hypothetical protein